MFLISTRASIAQLVEQLICNQWVGSSSLSGAPQKKANQIDATAFHKMENEETFICSLFFHLL